MIQDRTMIILLLIALCCMALFISYQDMRIQKLKVTIEMNNERNRNLCAMGNKIITTINRDFTPIVERCYNASVPKIEYLLCE